MLIMITTMIMAATLFGVLNVFLCFSLTLGRLEDLSTQNAGTIEQKWPKCTLEAPFLQFYRISSTLTYRDRVLRAVSKWEHHGMTLLAVPEHFIMLDLTVHMDIHPQPGPELTSEDSGKRDTVLRKICRSRSGRSSLFKTIERETLLSLRRYAYKPCASVIGDLKALGILKYRGRRGGKKAKYNASLERHPKSIEVVESRRPSKTYKQRCEHGNLICIPRENNSTRVSPSTEFAVPKCLFTNICGLAKSKNRLRAPVAIEAHLNNQDIDICVVSETHLSTDLPDSIVNIRV